MRSTLFALVCFAVVVLGAAIAKGGEFRGPKVDAHTRALLDAIRMVESGNAKHPRVGDGGRAIGRYQIWADYWRDGCEWGGVKWDYRTLAYSDRHAEQVILWYWQRYGARTDEQRARMHNGGLDGPNTLATLPYWHRVQAAMKGGAR
jgi:hypothetical protein